MGSTLLLIILIVGGLFFYFLPWVIAGKHNSGQVFVVNFFFGWSLIGWVIALVMALKTDPNKGAITAANASVSKADELQKLIEMKEAGSITDKEFNKMKKKLM